MLPLLRSFGLRLIGLTLLWVIIREGTTALWPGVAVAAAATLISLRLSPPRRGASLYGALVLAMRIPAESVAAGFDVAFRALHPRLPIQPGIVRVPLGLSSRASRLTLLYVMTIQPGTIAVNAAHGHADVHVIDTRIDLGGRLAHLERLIRRIWKEDRDD